MFLLELEPLVDSKVRFADVFSTSTCSPGPGTSPRQSSLFFLVLWSLIGLVQIVFIVVLWVVIAVVTVVDVTDFCCREGNVHLPLIFFWGGSIQLSNSMVSGRGCWVELVLDVARGSVWVVIS